VRTIQAAIDRIIARQSHGDFSDPLIVVEKVSGTISAAVEQRGGAGVTRVFDLSDTSETFVSMLPHLSPSTRERSYRAGCEVERNKVRHRA
jgi:hypothetical protein